MRRKCCAVDLGKRWPHANISITVTDKQQIDQHSQEEAAKFLQADFNQCFQQLRHYDSQLLDILKFQFGSYTFIVGTALGLYQFGLKEQASLTLPAVGVLVVGLIFGVLMYSLAIRHRVYFVLVARYINEQRGFFLKQKPLGFENKTRMYTNPAQPPYFNWRSSQAWYLYFVAILNSALLGVLIFLLVGGSDAWWVLGVAGLLSFIAQVWSAVRYLTSREPLSASVAVFERE